MKIQFQLKQKTFQVDTGKQLSLAIELKPNGEQPNHFGVANASSKLVESGSFIGDTRQGGSCNASQLTLIPHCNGTHTESVSHIVNQSVAVYRAIDEAIFPCVLISLQPEIESSNDSYLPQLEKQDKVITRQQLETKLAQYSDEQLVGLAIRTLPNYDDKKTLVYNAENYPPFLTNDAMKYLLQRKVQHLMVDFPSVDKMYDDGLLSNHRLFWNVELNNKNLNEKSLTQKTITEMIFVDNQITDGFYLCNLQVPQIDTDAVPSQPVLYRLQEM